MDVNVEELRKKLLDEIYASTLLGVSSMIIEDADILRASDREIIELAREYGFCE